MPSLSLSLFVWGDLVSSCSDLLIHMLTFGLTALIHSAIYLCVFMYCLPADTLQLRLFVRLYREKPVEIRDYSHYVCIVVCKTFVVVVMKLFHFANVRLCLCVFVFKMSERSEYTIQHCCWNFLSFISIKWFFSIFGWWMMLDSHPDDNIALGLDNHFVYI